VRIECQLLISSFKFKYLQVTCKYLRLAALLLLANIWPLATWLLLLANIWAAKYLQELDVRHWLPGTHLPHKEVANITSFPAFQVTDDFTCTLETCWAFNSSCPIVKEGSEWWYAPSNQHPLRFVTLQAAIKRKELINNYRANITFTNLNIHSTITIWQFRVELPVG
jgi:hypothetical protein